MPCERTYYLVRSRIQTLTINLTKFRGHIQVILHCFKTDALQATSRFHWALLLMQESIGIFISVNTDDKYWQ